MMKKSHGPAFRKELKPLMQCGTCRGTGVVSGVFHQLDCTACHGSGWVCQVTGDALPLEDLVPQMNLKLRHMTAELTRLKNRDIEQNNRLGAGGTNYTGD